MTSSPLFFLPLTADRFVDCFYLLCSHSPVESSLLFRDLDLAFRGIQIRTGILIVVAASADAGNNGESDQRDQFPAQNGPQNLSMSRSRRT